MTSLRFALLFVLTCALCVACAEGGGPGVGGDGSAPTMDGGGRSDGGDEADAGGGGGTDAGAPGCPDGQHACGGGCIDDLDNLPDNGCRFGCGEPCPTRMGGSAGCSEAGTCTFECDPPFELEGEACVCAPMSCEDLGYMCGAPDDGCGVTIDCGTCGDGDCVDGTCSCPPDAREPNNTQASAVDLGDATDAPDTNLVFGDFSLHSAMDEDWFTIDVSDDFDAGNPQVRVTVRDIPTGDDYDLGAWYVCDAGGDDHTCDAGGPDSSFGGGCVATSSGSTPETVEIATECSSTDESGQLIIRITASRVTGACANYELEVDVR